MYINVHSNHPPNIIKNLPANISKRINDLSADEIVFNKSKDLYNNALSESGFQQKISFENNTTNKLNNTRKRGRKIIWFNPPYSLNVSTNIGKRFFQLLDKHFPKTHKFHKLFNRNNVKVSYSSLPNFKSIVNAHNKNILREQEKPSPCNCRDKNSCPLNGNCQHKNLVYSCKVSTPNINSNHPHYFGLTEYTFKDRLYKHRNSFKYESKRNATEISNFFWDKKKEKIDVELEWSILDKAKPYSPESKKCMLCLTEKYHIIFSNKNLFNKRNELVTKSKCRHENKFSLKNYKDIPP